MQHHSEREAVLASLRCQEVGSLVRVELRIYRYNAAQEEVDFFLRSARAKSETTSSASSPR